MRAAEGLSVDITDSRTEQFLLVAPVDANPAHGKLSVASPVGAALLGLQPGDSADVATPTGTRTYRLDAVREPDSAQLAPAPRPPKLPARRRRRAGAR